MIFFALSANKQWYTYNFEINSLKFNTNKSINKGPNVWNIIIIIFFYIHTDYKPFMNKYSYNCWILNTINVFYKMSSVYLNVF